MENHPRIVNVDSERMRTLESMAKATMDASEVHRNLQELESTETEYLAEREGRAVAAVERVVEESEGVLKQAEENYRAAEAVAGTVSSLSGRVSDILGRVKTVLSLFDEKSRLWEARAAATEERLLEAKRAGVLQKGSLDAQRASQDKRAQELVDWEQDLRSRETALRKDIEELTPN